MDNQVLSGKDLQEVLDSENIIGPDKLFDLVSYVITGEAESIGRTLGPAGAYALICNVYAEGSPVFPSKDGFSIMQEVKYNDQNKYFIGEIVKDISRRMNTNVGDGTTSGVVIANKLFHLLSKYDITTKYPDLGVKLPPISMRHLLEAVRKELSVILLDTENDYIIDGNAINDEQRNTLISKVANISSNNDSEVSDVVADLFAKRKSDTVYVTTQLGVDDTTEVKPEIGFEFNGGMIDDDMANTEGGYHCIFKKPMFLLIDGPCSNADLKNVSSMIAHVNSTLNRPLVIIAADFEQEVENNFKRRVTRFPFEHNKQQHVHEPEDLCCIRIDTSHNLSRKRLDDIRLILGATVLKTKKGKIMDLDKAPAQLEAYLGNAESFTSSKMTTRIKGGAGPQKPINDKIAKLEERLKGVDLSDGNMAYTTVGTIRKRIAMLNSDMSKIIVGGASDKERRAKQLLFDDAIEACKSSVKFGFTLGGNISIPHIIQSQGIVLVERIIDNIVSNGKYIIPGNTPEDLIPIITDILNIVSESFKAAYERVVVNMYGPLTKFDELVESIYAKGGEYQTFNLVKNQYEKLDVDTNLVVPGNTDTELLSSVFMGVGTLISSDQLLSVFPGEATLYGVNHG